MDEHALRELLESVRQGHSSIEEALGRLRRLPFEDLGFAKLDHHRDLRCGFPEVIYCEGKTTDQVITIFEARLRGGGNILATRASPELAGALLKRFPGAEHCSAGRTVSLRQRPAVTGQGLVTIVAAGTSDMAVAEEARVTAEIMDQETEGIYDVGVAGLHRLLAHTEALQSASVVVVVAGMEGALASVVGGMVDCPVIAVPTSVGYGASFGGLAALLAMLNCCAAGVTVVNIDNGFGAGYTAALINRQASKRSVTKPNDS